MVSQIINTQVTNVVDRRGVNLLIQRFESDIINFWQMLINFIHTFAPKLPAELRLNISGIKYNGIGGFCKYGAVDNSIELILYNIVYGRIEALGYHKVELCHILERLLYCLGHELTHHNLNMRLRKENGGYVEVEYPSVMEGLPEQLRQALVRDTSPPISKETISYLAGTGAYSSKGYYPTIKGSSSYSLAIFKDNVRGSNEFMAHLGGVAFSQLFIKSIAYRETPVVYYAKKRLIEQAALINQTLTNYLHKEFSTAVVLASILATVGYTDELVANILCSSMGALPLKIRPRMKSPISQMTHKLLRGLVKTHKIVEFKTMQISNPKWELEHVKQ